MITRETTKDILGSLLQDNPARKVVSMEDNYASMLDFFDSKYGSDTERLNYAQVITSMKEETEVKALVKTYSKVLQKLLKFEVESIVSYGIWLSDGLKGQNQRIWNSLRCYLNDQIKRLFEENEYSDKLAMECLSNLRDGENETSIRDYISSKSSEQVKDFIKAIVESQQTVREAPKHMSEHNINTNDYKDYKPLYVESIKYLIEKGYHKGYEDDFFETKAQIFYFSDYKKLIIIGFIIIIVLIPIIFFIYLLSEIGIMGIILLIGLPGAVISIIRKGKI